MMLGGVHRRSGTPGGETQPTPDSLWAQRREVDVLLGSRDQLTCARTREVAGQLKAGQK
jgi:hypothetical protein